MKESIFRKKKKEQIKKRVRRLYNEGLTIRQIAKIFNKSHTWVWLRVRDLNKLSTAEDLTKNDERI